MDPHEDERGIYLTLRWVVVGLMGIAVLIPGVVRAQSVSRWSLSKRLTHLCRGRVAGFAHTAYMAFVDPVTKWHLQTILADEWFHVSFGQRKAEKYVMSRPDYEAWLKGDFKAPTVQPVADALLLGVAGVVWPVGTPRCLEIGNHPLPGGFNRHKPAELEADVDGKASCHWEGAGYCHL